jgi:hypothetical protein
MKLEGRTQKLIRELKAEGKVKYANPFRKEYMEQIKEIKDNWVYDLKKLGITVNFTYGDDPAYLI